MESNLRHQGEQEQSGEGPSAEHPIRGVRRRADRSAQKSAQLRAVGARIKELRKERGFTSQESFAYFGGFSRAYYANVEGGHRNVATTNLIRLAQALRVEVGALFPPLNELVGEADTTLPTIQAPGGRSSQEATRQELEAGAESAVQDSAPGHHAETALIEAPAEENAGDVGSHAAVHDRESLANAVRSAQTQTETETEIKGTLIGTGTAARLLGVNQRTVERLAAKGTLPAFDTVDGRNVVFRREDIVKVAEEWRQRRERDELARAKRAEDRQPGQG